MAHLARRMIWFVALTILGAFTASPFALAQQNTKAGELTVERIYGQPSLSGRPTRGVVWMPDGKKVSFFEPNTQGKTELWTMDAASGERSLLVSADKLESILPAPAGNASQATGAGRRGPAQYQWATSGDAILFEGANSLAWFDLKARSGRALVTGKEELTDVKISPNGQYVSFVRQHNLWRTARSGPSRPEERKKFARASWTGYIPRNWICSPRTGGRRIQSQLLIWR